MADTSDTANLSHHTLQPIAIALIFLFPAAATVSLALRAYSRSLTQTFGTDDGVIFFAGVLYWAFTYVSYKVIKVNYIGYHLWDIPADYNLRLGMEYGYASEILYNPLLAIVKTSILLFLLRLTGQKTAVRKSIWALLIFNGIMAVVTFLLTVLHCVPVQANWDSEKYPNAKCMNFADFVTGTACVSIMTDALVLLLPTWIVYDLKIQRKQKLMLIGILSFGLVTVVVGIIRVVLLDAYDRHPPVDYNYSILFCLSTFEVGLSFIAACAPSFKPIISKLLPKLFGLTSGSGKYGKYGNGGTGRPSRLGYQLDHISRKTEINRTRTQVEADGASSTDGDLKNGHGSKEGIVKTTETEVRWHSSAQIAERGTSTESLV